MGDVPRRHMTPARRLRIYTRDKGLCEACGGAVALTDCDVDHRLALWLSGRDDDANLRVMCRPCHVGVKTPADAKTRAKTKRQAGMLVGAERKPSRLKSRNEWPKGRRLQSKGFGK